MLFLLWCRKGRIGIYEGDDLKVLAKNFSRTFNLSRTMLISLEEHLQQSYDMFMLERCNSNGGEHRLPSELGYSRLLS